MIVLANRYRLRRPLRPWISMKALIEHFSVLYPKIEALNYFEVCSVSLSFILSHQWIYVFSAPRVDRHAAAKDGYVHPSEDRTINEYQPARTATSDLPPFPMPPMDTSSTMLEPTIQDLFVRDAIGFLTSAIDCYPIYQFVARFSRNMSIRIIVSLVVEE